MSENTKSHYQSHSQQDGYQEQRVHEAPQLDMDVSSNTLLVLLGVVVISAIIVYLLMKFCTVPINADTAGTNDA